MSFSRRSRFAVRFVAAFGLALISCGGYALAAESSPGELVKVDVYKGPAILLDEPEKLKVVPTIVTK